MSHTKRHQNKTTTCKTPGQPAPIYQNPICSICHLNGCGSHLSASLYFALQPIVCTAATGNSFGMSIRCVPTHKPLLPFFLRAKTSSKQNSKSSGGAPSPDLVLGLLSDFISHHQSCFARGQFYENAKHTPATGLLHMIQPQPECLDSDSHTPPSLTSHVYLLTCLPSPWTGLL